MRVLSIVHERDAGSGVFADVAGERGDELIEWIPAEGATPGLDGVGAVLVFGGGMHVDQDDEHSWLRVEKEVLRVFLASRGNMKELERHLGVSYPTARARFDALLGKMGIERGSAAPPSSRLELMEQVARGEIDVDEALQRLQTT